MSPASASAEKTERLLNLVLCLKSARRPISKAKIRESLSEYRAAPSVEAFDRMFERDKDALRDMGIPVTTAVIDVLFDDEIGYRIDSSETELPEIHFDPDEITALALAARAWAGASISGAATAALRKLRLAGVEIDEANIAGLEPRIRTREAAFEPVRQALLARQPITFDYTRSDGASSTRHLQPWGMKHLRGRWYVTGFDVDRGEQRAFRLGRISGPVRKKGGAGRYDIPEGHVPEVAIQAQEREPLGLATIRLREGAGHSLRRRASALRDLGDGASGIHQQGEGWTEIEVPYVPGNTERDVIGLGRNAIAVAPQELVEAVRSTLAGVAAAHRAGAGSGLTAAADPEQQTENGARHDG